MLLGEMLEQEDCNNAVGKVKISPPPKQLTKDDYLAIIRAKEEDIKNLHAEIDKLEKYRVHQEAADETKALHTALMNSGFSNEQAFELVQTMLKGILEANADRLGFRG